MAILHGLHYQFNHRGLIKKNITCFEQWTYLLTWIGLDWIGLDWFGLDWIGLDLWFDLWFDLI